MAEKRLPPPRSREPVAYAREAPSRKSSVSGDPVISGARGSFVGAYLLGGVLVALLLLRFGFGP